jgi:hypothetical protein
MFHVERHPIQEAAPKLRAPRYQVMNVRIYDLQWQCFGKRCSARRAFTAYSHLQTLAAISESNREFAVWSLYLCEKHKLRLAVFYQIRRTGTPK